MDTLRLADDLELTRMGYGALALAGPGAWGPPRDRSAAIAVLREAVDRGVNHIDTSDYYGPHTVNDVIREALHPYPEQLRIVTKVGARRAADRSWPAALSRPELVSAVEDNLRNLGLETLDLVNLRVGTERHGPDDNSIAEPFTVLAELRQAGKIRHLGVSNVTTAQLAQAQQIAPVLSVQNRYSVALRRDDALVQTCARQGISFVGFSGSGFAPVQSQTLEAVATRLGASVQQVMLAWLLQRTPTTLVIPTTGSVAHLRDNLAAAELTLPPDAVADLDAVGARTYQMGPEAR
jgi:aryl-alcohol dehydrogenase-like predicted oxidoreductase